MPPSPAIAIVTGLQWGKNNNNNNHQAFYSQASWGRLEMKPHKPKKTWTKQERKRRGKTKGDKKPNKKKEKRQ
jgi:hypothetical protein